MARLRAQEAEDCDSRLQPEHADHPHLIHALTGMILGVDLFKIVYGNAGIDLG